MGCTCSTEQEIENPVSQQMPGLNFRHSQSRQNQVMDSPDISYNFPVGEQIDFKCPSGHSLFKVTENLYANNQYYCDLCGEDKNALVNPSNHCQDCEFDMCQNCLEEQHTIKQICPRGHRLLRVSDLEAFHHEGGYELNGYICDLCGRSRDAKEDPVYHCSHCKFDMCPLCYRQQHKSDYYCPSGHRLYRVSDLKTFNQGNAYNNNTYGCHFCKRVLQAEEYPVMHCPTCRFDVCHDCMKAHMMGSDSHNGEENKEIEGGLSKVIPERKDDGTDNKISCVMCLRESRTYVFEPCKHFCACESCAWMLYNDRKPCPMCRREIKNLIKIFVV